MLSNFLKFRSYSTSISGSPLTQALPNFISTPNSSMTPSNSDVNVTNLNNGLTIASQNKFGMHCTLGGIANSLLV